jgi:hypothetical protein
MVEVVDAGDRDLEMAMMSVQGVQRASFGS